jgi:hypothetical protein
MVIIRLPRNSLEISRPLAAGQFIGANIALYGTCSNDFGPTIRLNQSRMVNEYAIL